MSILRIRLVKAPPQLVSPGQRFPLKFSVSDDLALFDCFDEDLLLRIFRVRVDAVMSHGDISLLEVDYSQRDILLSAFPRVYEVLVTVTLRWDNSRDSSFRLRISLISLDNASLSASRQDSLAQFLGCQEIGNIFFLPVYSPLISFGRKTGPGVATTDLLTTERVLFPVSRAPLTILEWNRRGSLGTHVWDCALVLAYHISIGKIPIEKYNLIVELGAGCGLLGRLFQTILFPSESLSHSHSAQKQLILTDIGDEILELLGMNIAPIDKHTTALVEYDWNAALSSETFSDSEYSRLLQRQALSMSKMNGESSVLIIAADVLYNHDSHDCFLATLKKTSQIFPKENINVDILIGYKKRSEGEQVFFEKARRCGFEVTLFLEEVCGCSVYKLSSGDF